MAATLPERIVLLAGLPGSGKSTYAAQRRLPVLSSDAVRLLLADDETDQTIHGRVFATIRYLLMQRLEIHRPVTCIDATHLTRAERSPYIRIARRSGSEIHAVFFDVPLEICQERNRARARIVPDDVLLAMSLRLQAPTLEEGFDEVEVIGAPA